MKPTDSQIARSARILAERTAPEGTPLPAAERAWRNALSYARDTDNLQRGLEFGMPSEAQDTEIREAWRILRS